MDDFNKGALKEMGKFFVIVFGIIFWVLLGIAIIMFLNIDPKLVAMVILAICGLASIHILYKEVYGTR